MFQTRIDAAPAGRADWDRIWRFGDALAAETVRRGAPVDDPAIMWALLRDAASVAARAYRAPPRSGLPAKSCWPDAPDEVTNFQRMAAYIRGELDEMPESEAMPPLPDAAAVSRAGVVLHIWHWAALRDGEKVRRRMRMAVWLKACGAPDRRVREATGYSRDQLKAGRRAAMADMLRWSGKEFR